MVQECVIWEIAVRHCSSDGDLQLATADLTRRHMAEALQKCGKTNYLFQ